MAGVEVQVEIQLEDGASGQHAPGDRAPEESAYSERLQNSGQREVDDEPLSLLADVALAPSCGDHSACSRMEVKEMETGLQTMQLQLQFFMHKVDDFHNCLVDGQGPPKKEALAAAVVSFLYTCQPYFNHLESTVRSLRLQHTPLTLNIYTKLLDFSQQLCDRLEMLVLTYASYNLLYLDETQPKSVSHFCIGQSQVGQLRLTAFRYCKPTPYLARVDTGLYKRMRWNVDRLQDEQQTNEEQGGEAETEYYFLCYEDIAHAEADKGKQDFCDGNVVRTWSIGQWMQVDPDPDTEDIYDWISCEVPRATYHKLVFLGNEEPSCCFATDYLKQLLLSWQTRD